MTSVLPAGEVIRVGVVSVGKICKVYPGGLERKINDDHRAINFTSRQ